MYIRFHKGQYVDAVIPSAVGIHPPSSPGDIVWLLSADINPSKVVQVEQPVQAVDPATGQPLFNDDGTPQWETTTTEGADGEMITQVVTHMVPQTVYLLQLPTNFTPDDIAAACQASGVEYTVAGSINEAKLGKKAELRTAYNNALDAGFQSAADGTTRTYGYTKDDRDNMQHVAETIDLGIAEYPIEYADIEGNPVAFTTADEFKQLAKDAQSFNWAQVAKLRQLENAVDAAATMDDLSNINW